MKYLIYFISCYPSPREKYTKIGFSSNLEKRLAELQIANPFTLVVEHSIEVKSKMLARRYERMFHKHLKHRKQHHKGEWFKLKTDIKDLVKEVFDRNHTVTPLLKSTPDALFYNETEYDFEMLWHLKYHGLG